MDLPLAHLVTSDGKFEISVFIGADYYWQFVQDCIVPREGSTTVQSHLSYQLSGPLPLSKTTNLHIAILSCTCIHTSLHSLMELTVYVSHEGKTTHRCHPITLCAPGELDDWHSDQQKHQGY